MQNILWEIFSNYFENLKSESNSNFIYGILFICETDSFSEIDTLKDLKNIFNNKIPLKLLPYFLEFKPPRNFSPPSGSCLLIFRNSFKLSLVFWLILTPLFPLWKNIGPRGLNPGKYSNYIFKYHIIAPFSSSLEIFKNWS